MTSEIKQYEDDFFFLSEILSFMKEFMKSGASETKDRVLKKGLFSKLPNGRSVRVVIPRVSEIVKCKSLDDDLYFVGFIGYSRPSEEISPYLSEKIWKTDSDLIDEFSNHDDILAYVSAERNESEWGNLVLLQSLGGIEKWKKGLVHQEAINEIAPNYYTKIRIHRGKLQNGELITEKTLFLDYTSASKGRSEKVWR